MDGCRLHANTLAGWEKKKCFFLNSCVELFSVQVEELMDLFFRPGICSVYALKKPCDNTMT